MNKATKRRHYVVRTEDGRYGLTSKGELWKIAGRHSYLAGEASHPEHIEAAAHDADEEMKAMAREFREFY
tara:strand:+ start:915 stop:1124 length:210 start_codon:yes stop_codon:yes gene_type:complete